jgi:ParB family chromosome partitioning protein
VAELLAVSEVWLPCYLELARLPVEVANAFASIGDTKEQYVRTLKPLLKTPESREKILNTARDLAKQQKAARVGQGALVDAQKVMTAFKVAVTVEKPKGKHAHRGTTGSLATKHIRRGKKHLLEMSTDATRAKTKAAFAAFLKFNY